jgi:hypothetical protein
VGRFQRVRRKGPALSGNVSDKYRNRFRLIPESASLFRGD